MKLLVFSMVFGATFAIQAFSALERDVVASVIIAEAGGEGVVGMEAVMEVVQTRAAERRKTAFQIVTQPKQFSCLNGKSPDALIKKAKQHARWEVALRIAGGTKTNHTKAANHYYAPKGVSKVPSWAEGKKPTATIGGHVFYRL